MSDLLRLVKQDKFENEEVYDNWELKDNYEYFENEEEGENVVFIEEKFNNIAPLWYYLNTIQNKWVDIIRKTDLLNIHEDYDEENKKNRYLMGDDFKKVVNEDLTKIMVKRNKVRGQDNVVVDDSEEEIELLYVFVLMDFNYKLDLLNTVVKHRVTINGEVVRLYKKDAPHLVKIEDTYFVHYNKNMVPDDRSRYEEEFTYYEIIHFFTFTDNIDSSKREWMKIREYYKEGGNKKMTKVWNIPLESVELESHKSYFYFLKKGSEEYKDVVKQNNLQFQKEDNEFYIDVEEEEEEEEYALNVVPKYKVDDIIKIIPENYEDFGIPDFERKSYHYGEIIGINRNKGQYKIKYFPPYDKLKLWKATVKTRNANKDYVENHNIEAIEGAIPTLLDLDDPKHVKELQNYMNKLRNVFKIELIIDHKPPRKGAKKDKNVKKHSDFVGKVNSQYLVKYKDVHESFNEYQDAAEVYEKAKSKVDGYWRKLYPTATRRRNMRNSTLNQRQNGGYSKRKSKSKRKTLKKKRNTLKKKRNKKKTK